MVKESTHAVKEIPKKRRKLATTTEVEQEQDLYSKTVGFEEKEAFKRSAATDSRLYFDTCKKIRSLLAEIAELKHKADNAPKVTEKCLQACSLIVVLKKLNRLEKVRSTASRENLNAEKLKVDTINLQYHNLLYEAAHLTAEYKKCQQFKSKDEDIELISIEEFLKEAPETIKEQFGDDVTERDEHALHIARLEYELEQRKKLAELCGLLEVQKKQLAEDIVEQKNRLDGLMPKLQAVLEAAKPLQEHLGMQTEKMRTEHRRVGLLPDPLYLLYANTDAYKKVYNINVELEVIGDEDKALQWKHDQYNRTCNPTNSESESEEEKEDDDQEEQDIEEMTGTTSKKRRRRMTASVVNIDPHEQKRREKEEKQRQLLKSHPFSVSIIIKVASDGPTLKMAFFYRPALHIVTVRSTIACPTAISSSTAMEVLFSENVLGELVDEDNGLWSPNPSNYYQLQKVGVDNFRSLVSDVGFAYIWAQRLCGLDFVQKIDKDGANKLSQSSVEIVMKLINCRLKSRNALAAQLQKLEQNVYPAIPTDFELPRLPVSCLSKFASSSYQIFCQHPAAAHLFEAELIDVHDLFYAATITRNKATLFALIAVKGDYPRRPPLFALSIEYNGQVEHSASSDDLRDMERAVNTNWATINTGSSKKAKWLLSAQLRYLSAYMDVYLETVDSVIFPKNIVFFKSKSGRNRMCPFKFRRVGAGIFTHT